MAAPMTDVTQILSQIASGDAKATNQLLPLIYDDTGQQSTQVRRPESWRNSRLGTRD
jgi:hypothetical protein